MVSFKVLNNDFIINGRGRLEEIEGKSRLLQNVSKLLKTTKENIMNSGDILFRYNPNYGTNLAFVQILNKLLSTEDAAPAVKDEVKEGIILYTSIQSEKQNLNIDPTETLVDGNVLAVPELIEIEGIERVVIQYDLELITQDGKSIEISDTISDLI